MQDKRRINNDKERGIAFDPKVYRIRSQDLRTLQLTDSELEEHFNSVGYSEPRSYGLTYTACEYFSISYLRGYGIEIGAGANPTPLLGNAECEYGDIAHDALFDSKEFKLNKIIVNLNGKLDPASGIYQKYDFVVASHVLEHCDSFIHALIVLRQLCRAGGIVYIALPILEFEADSASLKEYSLLHHCIEYFFLRFFKKMHKERFLGSIKRVVNSAGEPNFQGSEVASEALRREMEKGNIPEQYDYIYHRHSYSLQGWLSMFIKINSLFDTKLKLIDCGFGHDRNDGHFVFKVC